MAILPGRRLGPYEILSAIGAGGMGEVYKARDTRLDRIVAIKVLPTHLADRAELRERFEREAKTIASLNHPHICTLYDTGHQDGIDFLVMEYLEGETLAQRLQKGALPIQQVLQYAIEIADALDKAHRKGITHRDLKPGNIMLTKSGTKLLDFGLAKLKQEAAPATPESQLPTMKGAITGEGNDPRHAAIHGAGTSRSAKEVDARTDIFAFGAVVYEMATGKKAFEGKSQASVMAKIMETDPPSMSSLQPMTPPQLDRVVKKCMAKDPDERWQSAERSVRGIEMDFRRRLASRRSGGRGCGTSVEKESEWVAAFAIAVAVARERCSMCATGLLPLHVRFDLALAPPEKVAFDSNTAFLSISPDGSKLAFVAGAGTNMAGSSSFGASLWIRSLDSPTAQALPGTEGASQPFWSPDSQFVGFFAGGHLKKIAVSGGPPQVLADAPSSNIAAATSTGGTWNRDGVILFTANFNRR